MLAATEDALTDDPGSYRERGRQSSLQGTLVATADAVEDVGRFRGRWALHMGAAH